VYLGRRIAALLSVFQNLAHGIQRTYRTAGFVPCVGFEEFVVRVVLVSLAVTLASFLGLFLFAGRAEIARVE
jgi:hypothetical protein